MNELKQHIGNGGYCICLSCNHKEPHINHTPCKEMTCPKCGKKMIREGSEHHKLFIEKQKIKT